MRSISSWHKEKFLILKREPERSEGEQSKDALPAIQV